MVTMWIDERGSVVLDSGESHRLLALGAKQGIHGHLGIPEERAPLVLPVNYVVHGADLVIRIGEGLFERVERAGLVAFQVDGVDAGRPWSVLVRGLATEEDRQGPDTAVPLPEVTDPGRRIVRIRADVITGRQLVPASDEHPGRSAPSRR